MPDEIKDDDQPPKDSKDSSVKTEEESKDSSLKEAGDLLSIFGKNFKVLWKDYMKKGFPLDLSFEHYLRDTIQDIAHKVVKELQKQAYEDPDSPYHNILSKWNDGFFNAMEYDLGQELFEKNKKPLDQVLDMDLTGMDAIELTDRFLTSEDEDEDHDGLDFKIGVPKPKFKMKIKPLELVQHGLHPEAFEEIRLYERLKLTYESELVDFKAKLKLEGSVDMEGIRKWTDITLPVLEKKSGGSAELELQLTVHPENQPFRFSINGGVEYSNTPHPEREGRREENIDASINIQLELWFENRQRRDEWEKYFTRETSP